MNDCYTEKLLVGTDKLDDEDLFRSRVVGDDLDLIRIDALLRTAFGEPDRM